MYKKILKAILAIYSLLFPVLAMAIDIEQIAIGGITPGSTFDYAESIYGQPDRSKVWHAATADRRRMKAMYWGNGFSIDYYQDMSGQLFASRITVYSKNGLGTPAGLAVGQNIQTMYDLYGNPDNVWPIYDKTDTFMIACDYGYHPNGMKKPSLVVTVKNNIIVRIAAVN